MSNTSRTAVVYFGVTLLCGLFSIIYEYFSHGVYSNAMMYMFLYPLLGGALPYGAIRITGGLRAPGRTAMNLYNSGIAALTVGSCFAGALEIYGTTSIFVLVYRAAGIAFIILGIVFCFIQKSSSGRASG
jgi:hypothetical protein